MNNNAMAPIAAEIKKIVQETPDVKTFTIAFTDPSVQSTFSYQPGQFMEISLLGIGEAPISITSAPSMKGSIELSIRKVGQLTEAIHRLTPGNIVGLRGPYGNGWPFKEVAGYNLLFIGGGIGLAPLRSMIKYVFDHRGEYGLVKILYGARNPQEIVFGHEMQLWAKQPDTEILVTVDRGDKNWSGNVGLVTSLFPQISVTANNCVAFVCGPPVMVPFVIKDLLNMGFAEDKIISTLENYMKCGIGKCGHCLLGGKYICLEGPVFKYSEMKKMQFG